VAAAGGAVDLLVLPAESVPAVWVCESGPARRLLLSEEELAWGPDGRIEAYDGRVQAYDPSRRAFADLPLDSPAPSSSPGPEPSADPAAAPLLAADAAAEPVRPAGRAVPVSYGKFDGRQSAPPPEAFDELAAVFQLDLPAWAGDAALDALLRIGWAGDAGQLQVDGRPVTDRFWDGSEWVVSLRDIGYRRGSELSLHLLPLAAGSPVSLPHDARDRLVTADGQLLALDYVRVLGRRVRRETA
jgi:hypothetical protein